MDMRYLESVHVTKAVAHVLDKRLEEPLLGVDETELTEDLHEFFMKHILRSLRTDEAEKACFVGDGAVKQLIYEIFQDEDKMLENSQEMARRLFAIVKPIEGIASGDVAMVLFNSGEARYLAVLKLDYQKSYSHEVEYVNEAFNVKLVAQDIGLPLTHQKLTACAFIKEDQSDDSYDMILLEKSSGEEGPRWFMHRFLGADKRLDQRDKTKLFRKNVEQFARQSLKNDLDKALEVREQLNEELLGSAFIDLDSFAETLFSPSSEAKEKFDKKMESAGLLDGDKLEVDRNWVANKMKNRTIKTDTGFTLRGEYEFFDDSSRFEMRRNGDGSVDYVIKNVRNISER